MKIQFMSWLTLLAVIFVAACTYKPFQPPPPMFKVWGKADSSSQETIDAMRRCGLNEVTGYHKNKSVESTYMGEQCMESLGYQLSGRYKGICAGKIALEVIACEKIFEKNIR